MDTAGFTTGGREGSAAMRAATAGIGLLLMAAGAMLVAQGLRGRPPAGRAGRRRPSRIAATRAAERHPPQHMTTLEPQGRWTDESWLERHPASAIARDVALPDRPGPVP